MKLLLDERRDPKRLAYVIGGCLAVFSSIVANLAFGWPVTITVVVISILLGLFGVSMIESGCEAVVFVMIAAVPLVWVLWSSADYSFLKQIWLSGFVSHAAGKLWVGMIR